MLEARFFGTPCVTLNGQPLPALAHSRTLTSLFAFLITYRDRPHHRSVLAALFWPDHSEQRARRNLNNSLWELRCALKSAQLCPEMYLLSNSLTVQFDPAAPFWLDVAEFEAATTILSRSSRTKAELSEEGLRHLEYAVELYRGDFMKGIYDDWCLGLREQLREQFLMAMDRIVRTYQRWGRYEAALQAAQQLAQADALREEAHYRLVQLYAHLGRPHEARRQYQHYESLWRAELGLAPSAHE